MLRLTRLLFVASLFTLLLDAAPAAAQRTGTGIGGQIGDPSGLTLKFYDPASYSLDFLAAWDVDDFFFLNVHGTYERPLGTQRNANLFYGPGAFVGLSENGGDDEVVAGISGTFGANLIIDRFELYARLTPRLAVVPDTDGDIGAGLGVRYYL